MLRKWRAGNQSRILYTRKVPSLSLRSASLGGQDQLLWMARERFWRQARHSDRADFGSAYPMSERGIQEAAGMSVAVRHRGRWKLVSIQ